jgi:hypothetical protein
MDDACPDSGRNHAGRSPLRRGERNDLLKYLAITGGRLFVWAVGAGRDAIDRR